MLFQKLEKPAGGPRLVEVSNDGLGAEGICEGCRLFLDLVD